MSRRFVCSQVHAGYGDVSQLMVSRCSAGYLSVTKSPFDKLSLALATSTSFCMFLYVLGTGLGAVRWYHCLEPIMSRLLKNEVLIFSRSLQTIFVYPIAFGHPVPALSPAPGCLLSLVWLIPRLVKRDVTSLLVLLVFGVADTEAKE